MPIHNLSFSFDQSEPENKEGFFFIYHRQALAFVSEGYQLPSERDISTLPLEMESFQFFGYWDGTPCYSITWPHNFEPPTDLHWQRIRGLIFDQKEPLFWVAGYGHHLAHWHHTHQFCGICGSATQILQNERARRCVNCGNTTYPRISPAVIMAVTKGNKILLGKQKGRGLNMFSVLAGFVEPGETLEQCVAREVKEETGIEIQNIQYFGSQPWAFPDQLMIAFRAEYKSGEITLDDELEEAEFFLANDLPRIPPKPSISRELIDWFLTAHSIRE